MRYVAEKIAALREIPLEAFAQITMQNALNAYSIKELVHSAAPSEYGAAFFFPRQVASCGES